MARTASPTSTPAGRNGTASLRRLLNRGDGTPRIGSVFGENASRLGEVIGDCCTAGVGVLISPTRDLNAVSVTIYVGDDRERAYASSSEEFASILEALADTASSRLVSGPGGS